tara:strand:+ start:2104 stop:2637 length:534 start_codon:yes stop_codon:yes gene_type:complete
MKKTGICYKTIKGQNKDSKHDDYATPQYAWDEIINFIPKNKTIYEPFYLDGGSGEYLKSQGLDVIHRPIDFFENAKNLDYDFILSNPPYSDCKGLFKFLKELDKPFMLLLPTVKLHTNYISNFYDGTNTQIIIPRKRVHFLKYEDKKPVKDWKNGTSFDCIWFCYKMNFTKDIQYGK